MALQDDVRNLALLPALRDLDQGALRLIAFAAETRILRAGDMLFLSGDRSDGGYVVLSGAISLTTEGATTVIRPPALIGAAALITDTLRPATAVASEASSVLKISRELFRRVLTEHPESAVRMRNAMFDHVTALQQDMAKLQQTLRSSG